MPEVGIIAERFDLEQIVGAGGMGSVYRARDLRTGAAVAVKLLRVVDDETRGRFLREARVLCELSAPGIVRYVSHGTTAAGELYLAMEWLDGEDLAHRLERGRLSVSDSLALLERVASALAAAHQRGIVHRDINPSNLFLVGGAVEQVKIIDFGIAKDPTHPATTVVGTLVGTPSYMSPEQARGRAALDPRTDVFALGLVLYECLTGKRAFVADSIMGILAKILFEDPPAVHDLQPDVPAPVDELLRRLLAKDPAVRPCDAAAVAAALGDLAVGPGPVKERPPSVALTGREQRLLCVVCVQGADPWERPADEVPVAISETLPSTLAGGSGALFDTILRVVRQHAGRIEPLANGTLVAAFEGSGVATDQAVRAAGCALALRALLPDAPMVLATGRAFLGHRLPVGEVIDRAARLLGGDPAAHTGPGVRPIRLDHVTAALLDQRFEVRMAGKALELHAERPTDRVGRTLLGKPTPCVGRERDLGIILATLAECTSEPLARAVLVSGPAGMGKSRLRHELMRAVEAEEPLILFGRGDAMSKGAPFELAAQAIRGAAGVREGEPLEARQTAIRRRLAQRLSGPDLDRITTFIAELAGAAFADHHSLELTAARKDAILMGDQIRRAWDDWLLAETAARTVILMLENLQWGDLPSVRLVESALRNLHDRPLFVLALARPEVREVFPRLWSEVGMQEISLGPLSRRAGERLVRHVLGDDTDAELVRDLVERAGGNAFFLEELIRSAAEGGDTRPETVVAMLAARLEGLEPEARLVLRGASIFGTVFWDAGVQALLGGALSAEQTAGWLRRLGERELISVRSSPGSRGMQEFAFRQNLVREAAYAMLTDTDRRFGHRLAGRFLEAAGESNPLVLAEHSERGDEPARAAICYHRAAVQALEGNDFEAALARVVRGIECGAKGTLLGALRVTEAEASRWRGALVDAERAARAAMGTLPPGSALWYQATAELARTGSAQGKGDELGALAEVLLACHAEADAQETCDIATLTLAGSLLQMGRYQLARRLMARVTEPARARSGQAQVSAWLHAVRGLDGMSQGDPATYLREMEVAARAFRELGDLRRACLYETNMGYAFLELGLYARAEPVLRGALAAARQLGLARIGAIAVQNLGVALAHRGVKAEALASVEEAASAFAAQGDRRLEASSRCYLSQILASSGELTRAEREAQAAVTLAASSPPTRAFALGQLAQTLAALRDPSGALRAAEQGMQILAALGSLEEGEALLRLAHIEALEAVGRHDEARAALTAARDRLRERAARITNPALRTSFLENVDENVRTNALSAL